MTKVYEMYYEETIQYETQLYAEDEEEARKKFEEMIRNGTLSQTDAEVNAYEVYSIGDDLYVI